MQIEECISFLLGKAYQHVNQAAKVRLAPHGVTPVQFALLNVLWAQDGISGADAEPLLRYDLIGPENGLRDIYKSDWNNFGPRLGFAWNPSFSGGILGKVFGDRKTVIRGGASMVYDRVGGAVTFIQDQVSYIFDGSKTTSFGVSLDPLTSLTMDPRFTGIGTLPIQNAAPVITALHANG